MDQALANALKEKKELEARLAEINTFLRLYRQFVSGTKPDQNVATSDKSANGDQRAVAYTESAAEAGRPDSESQVPRTELPRDEMAPLIRKTLIEVGRPLARSALLRELDKRGITVGGVDRPRNLGTLMWRLKDHFVNIEGRGYWPVGEPVPQDGGNLDLL